MFSDYQCIPYLHERDSECDGADDDEVVADDDEVVAGDALDAVDAARVADVGRMRTHAAVTTRADAARVRNLGNIQ